VTESVVVVNRESQFEQECVHLRRQLQFERERNSKQQQQISELQEFQSYLHCQHNENIDVMQRDFGRVLKEAKEEHDSKIILEAVKAQQEIFSLENRISHQEQLYQRLQQESHNLEVALYSRIEELKQLREQQECVVQSQHRKIEEQERLIASNRRLLRQMPSLRGVEAGEGENNLIPEDHPEVFSRFTTNIFETDYFFYFYAVIDFFKYHGINDDSLFNDIFDCFYCFVLNQDKYMPDFVGHFMDDVPFGSMPVEVGKVVKAMTKLPGTLSGSEKFVKFNGQRLYPRKLRLGLRLPIN
jgi:hypothetical protein